jgi:peroxiredoxin family protein
MNENMVKTTLVVASGDMDKLYSALIIGNGALAFGHEVSLYFTFYGLQRLKKGNLDRGGLSRMNFFGLGKRIMQRMMQKANVQSLSNLMKDFKELGGKIIACEMTLKVMGLEKKDLDLDLIDEYGAVGTYLNDAQDSQITLFI